MKFPRACNKNWEVVTQSVGKRMVEAMIWAFSLISLGISECAVVNGATAKPNPVKNVRMSKISSPAGSSGLRTPRIDI